MSQKYIQYYGLYSRNNMKREIKFRVRHNDTFHYFTIEQLMEKNLQAISQEPKDQYTGLRDKNGTEIYEGDIVACPTDCDPTSGDDLFFLAEVRWDSGYLTWLLYEADHMHEYEGEMEVIGNIYENGEMI